ncbi:YciI family protein [Frigoribacterium sp. VKM Ac-2836]|uniref:YciI family protein n=1 Tax=Frigoribacterium sp. VKM Ac-2836 TaxID=2739014 RepID=UPI001564BC42|nr:YciI family protein [Frigoribacterium sp. VKM Ac-2836]NRD27968.1 transcription initiation protein [Frigoribacterium sp. VKM Ac-2836]
MPKFITIGYGDRAGYDETEDAVRNRAHAADAGLAATGAIIGQATRPVQVRNHNGAKVEVSEGPYRRSDLPVAGFAVFDAEDLEEAIATASQSPCAVAQGVVEVWQLKE